MAATAKPPKANNDRTAAIWGQGRTVPGREETNQTSPRCRARVLPKRPRSPPARRTRRMRSSFRLLCCATSPPGDWGRAEPRVASRPARGRGRASGFVRPIRRACFVSIVRAPRPRENERGCCCCCWAEARARAEPGGFCAKALASRLARPAGSGSGAGVRESLSLHRSCESASLR